MGSKTETNSGQFDQNSKNANNFQFFLIVNFSLLLPFFRFLFNNSFFYIFTEQNPLTRKEIVQMCWFSTGHQNSFLAPNWTTFFISFSHKVSSKLLDQLNETDVEGLWDNFF